MSTYANAYFFKDKKSLRQFQDDINNGYGWNNWDKHPSASKSITHTFGSGMYRMLKDLDYTVNPDNIRVTLRASDLNELKPKDEYDENDIKILKGFFKELGAEFVFIG